MPWSLYSKWRWEAFVQPRKPTHPVQSHTHTQTTTLYFLQVISQGGRESGSAASYMGLVPGREGENRGEQGGLFDLLAASVWEAEWSRWAPITSPPTSSKPPADHTHEYNRWRWTGPWLCFQGVVFEVNGSIRLCFLRSFSSPPANTSKNVFYCTEGSGFSHPTTLLVYSSFPQHVFPLEVHFHLTFRLHNVHIVNESLSHKSKNQLSANVAAFNSVYI